MRAAVRLLVGLLLLGRAATTFAQAATFAQCGPPLPPPNSDIVLYSLNGQTVEADLSGGFLISNVSLPDFAPADFMGDDFLFLTAVKITDQQTLYAYGRTPFKIEIGKQFIFGTGVTEQDFSTFTTTPPVLPESITLQVDCNAPGAPPFCNSTITPLGSDGQCPNMVPCSVPLLTTANLSDGTQPDVTLPTMWTTYRTSNANIARVIPDDPMNPTTMLVEGVSPGVAFITATNGGATSVVRITVANPANLIFTTVEGFVRRTNGSPASGAPVTVRLPTTNANGEPVLQQIGAGTSDAIGFFSINSDPLLDTTPDILADATVSASVTEFGSSALVLPVPDGITDAGIITIDVVCDTPWSTAFGPTIFDGQNISAMVVFDDDGSGPNPPALFVGGKFSTAGGTTANNIAKWDGRRWVPLIGASGVNAGFNGVNAEVNGLAVVDLQDGNGPALYVAGRFIRFGGANDSGPGVNKIARWDGTNWSTVGAGVGNSEDSAYAAAGFDDGTGMELYVGGSFQKAGGDGVDQQNNCRPPNFDCIFSPSIAKWNPATDTWSDVGGGSNVNGIVRTLTLHDDGSGTSLFVGGQFSTMGGVNVSNVARWDGMAWTEVGPGGLTGFNNVVNVLTVFDFDGASGPNPPELYAGGSFGFSPALDVAKWNGTTWEPLGPGLNRDVNALVGLDNGVSRLLYATGEFDNIGGGGFSLEKIVAWNGASWSNVGTGIESFGTAMAVFDDGTGAALYVGGAVDDGIDCATGGGGLGLNKQGYVAKWDAPEWSVLGNGLRDGVQAMIVHDDGSGSALFAGGSFTPPKGPCDQNAPPFPISAVAKFDGSQWSSLGTGMDCTGFGCVASVHALVAFDENLTDSNPAALFVGGDFVMADGMTADNVAQWDGTNWSAVGTIGGIVEALGVFDDGVNGPALFAGGVIPGGIKVWDGATWTTLVGPGPVIGSVFAVAVFNGELYAGGDFIEVVGVPGTANLARWNGLTWSAVQSVGLGLDGPVYALTVFDNGTGLALYAGGEFLTAGGVTVNRVAKWDGTNWSAVSNGLGPTSANAIRVDTLFGFDDGSGPFLVAGGDFTTAPIIGGGTVPLNRLAKWNLVGNVWLPVGVSSQAGADPGGGVDLCTSLGCEVRVNALSIFDDGLTGPALFVGGIFETAAGTPSSNIAKLGCR